MTNDILPKDLNDKTIARYFEQLKTKEIYVWGSGKYFRNHTLPFLRESGLIECFRGHVDKTGLIGFCGQNIKAGEVLVLIAVTGYREIMSQIKGEPALAGFKAVPSIYLEALYEDMMMLSAPKTPVGFRKNQEITIPKIIHTFWFSERLKDEMALSSGGEKNVLSECFDREEIELPERYRSCFESWKRFAPDFEIKIWNQDNYHPENCLFYEQAIEKKCWAFASDYARADVLRRFGGVYMDLDVEMLRPIDDLLYNDAYMSFESLDRIECGSGMGAKAGNVILNEICKDYENRPFIKEDGSLDMSTCPVRFTNVIERHGLIKNGGFQMVEDITVYPFEYLTGKSFDTGIIYSSENSYTLHHHNGSWIPGKTRDAMEARYAEIAEFVSAQMPTETRNCF